MRHAGRMRPFASTPAARTKDTVIWSFNGQNCSFYNLNFFFFVKLHYFAFMNAHCMFLSLSNKNILQ